MRLYSAAIKYTETDIQDNLVSNHKINIGVTVNYEMFSLYAEGIWSSKKRIKSNHYDTPYSFLLDKDGYLNFDPVFLLNVNLRANDIWQGISFYLRVKNLLDKEYYGQTINAQWGSPMILQDMRRIDAGIDYEF